MNRAVVSREIWLYSAVIAAEGAQIFNSFHGGGDETTDETTDEITGAL